MHHIEQTVTARKLTRKGKLILPQTSAILLTPHAYSPHSSTRSDSPNDSVSDCSDEPPMLTPLDSCANTIVCPRCAARDDADTIQEPCRCCTTGSPGSSFEHSGDVDIESFNCAEFGMACNDYDYDLLACADDSLMTSTQLYGCYDEGELPAFVYQHNPYAFAVLPEHMYPTESIVGRRQKPARPGAGRSKKSAAAAAGQEKKSTRHLHHRNPIFQAPSGVAAFHAAEREFPSVECALLHEAAVVVVAAGAAEPPSPAPKVMCCYFKQKGFCKMGEKCWHGHEGDLYTPCHYGAECKAGHATLVQMQIHTTHNLRRSI